jgi:hypothetical protein
MHAIVIPALIVFGSWLLVVWVAYVTSVRFSIEESTKDTREREHSHEIMCDL